jgi:carbonic anhydrase
MCEHCSPWSRRNLITAAVAGAAATILSRTGAVLAQPATAPPPQNAISPDAALKRLMDGNARYAANDPEMRDFSAGRAALAKAQHPIAAVLGCADSRVAPELAFDQSPGDVFAVRLAGNFVTDDGLASLEYATKILNVPLIMVLGHSSCGAVSAAISVVKEKTKLPGHLPGLVNSIKPAVEIALKNPGPDLLATATAENVRINVRRLQQAKPIVAEMVKQGKVKVVGGVYELATGKVTLL